MIRAAKFQDVPLMLTMLHELCVASKYAGRLEISDKAADGLLMAAVAGQTQNGPQGSFCVIAEEAGEPVGFMIGTLDRVYHIATKLTANDLYLYVRPGNGLKHSLQMIDAYIEWASANPKVIEIMLSWSDTLPGAEGIADVYRRKGFHRTGEMFERTMDMPEVEAA